MAKYLVGHFDYYSSGQAYSSKNFAIIRDLIENYGYQMLYDTSKFLAIPSLTRYNVPKLKMSDFLEGKDRVDVVVYFCFHIGHFPCMSEIIEVDPSLKEKTKFVGFYEELHFSKYHEDLVQKECQDTFSLFISPSVPGVMTGPMKDRHLFLMYYADSDFDLPFNNNPEEKISLTGATFKQLYPPRYMIGEMSKHNDKIKVLPHPFPGMNKFQGKRHDIVGKKYAEYLNGFLCNITSPSYLQHNGQLLIYPIAKHFEILATGSLLLTSKAVCPLLKSVGLYENTHFLAYEDNEKSIEALINWVLDPENRTKVDGIRRVGKEAVVKEHLSIHRAEYLNNKIS